MKIGKETADEPVLVEIGRRLAAARLARNLTQAQLAAEAGVSKRTIERLEAGAVAVQLSGFVRACRTLGLLERLDILLPEVSPGPLEQLKLRGRAPARRRASPGVQRPEPAAGPWEWGAGT